MAKAGSWKQQIWDKLSDSLVDEVDELADLMVEQWMLPEFLDALAKSVKRYYDKLEAEGKEIYDTEKGERDVPMREREGMSLHSIRRLAADLRHLADWVDG